MKKQLKSEANKWLIIGFIVWFVGNALRSNSDLATIGLLVFVAGMAAFVYGCMLYAQAKGQNKWWGLLGIASLIGLIILLILPDKNK